MSAVDHNAIELSPRISEADVADYIALLKPRVMSLVIFTALVGLMIAPGHVHPVLAFTSILCIAVGAGASGALNMWYESDIDALMSRTANRPIPRGRVTRAEALTFGMTLAFFSVMTLGILVNWFAGALLAFTIFFYVVVYTMALKRWTAQNIVIGGAAGALPPVVAWVAATGSLSMEPLLLFLIIFFWTPPATTMRAPGCRCCPSSPAPTRRGCRSCCIPWCWSRSHSHRGRSVISTRSMA